MNLPPFLRTLGSDVAAHLVLCGVVAVIGVLAGWFAHGVSALAREPTTTTSATSTASNKRCHDEVWSVDNAHGPVSCTSTDHASELKDGYLICHCRKQ